MPSQRVSYAELARQNAELVNINAELSSKLERVERQLAWLQKQVFGEKSERRLIDDNPQQILLDGLVGKTNSQPPVHKETITYERGKAKKQRDEDCVTDTGLRFSDDVPVEVIPVEVPELAGTDADDYEVIDKKMTYRLAQRPASYVVLQYETPVVKRRSDNTFVKTAAPAAVFEGSIADVSFLAGLLIDKFQFHLPLYRQHQRLTQAGIDLSRATLTHLVKRSIALLQPIVRAQLEHVLQSRVLAMDETPIRAGPAGKGKMNTGWFWPLYGEADEVVFTYADSRARRQIETILTAHFDGTLLSDGYAAYARYVEGVANVTHAQCWVHTRRQYVEAEDKEPDTVATALELIGAMYRVETDIKEQGLTGEKKRAYRLRHSKPIVDTFFEWCEQQCHRDDLLPDNPVIKAIKYTLARTDELRVFLEDPEVQPDTNHLERTLRPIPMGRRSWLFCWTELGAEHVGIIQSLICTCKLHGVNPYTYLVDVLQRISDHPASDVDSLTPRVWKQTFADQPLRSDLHRAFKNGTE